ncbi:MAG: hypothetical protein U1E28_08830 [Beijerinckiaceae bacterium]
MVCAILLVACSFLSLRYGIAFADVCDEIADAKLPDALLFAPLI